MKRDTSAFRASGIKLPEALFRCFNNNCESRLFHHRTGLVQARKRRRGNDVPSESGLAMRRTWAIYDSRVKPSGSHSFDPTP
jgi:hypothetical protein